MTDLNSREMHQPAGNDADIIEVLVTSVTEQIQKLDQIPERLITVQAELRNVQDTLHQYAPRAEVRKARWRQFFLIIALVLGLQVVQSTEVTNCFLNINTKNPTVCHVLYPGYGKAVDQQRQRVSDLNAEVDAQRKFDQQVIQYKTELDKEIQQLQADVKRLQQGH